MPLFSIIIPAYNSGHLIEETITSFLNQTFEDYEIIVVDDGSTDNTAELLNKFADRIQILKQTNQGSAVARNAGIKQAQGKYIVSFDQDDILYPHALRVYHEIIKYFKNPPLIFSKQQYFGDKTEINGENWDGKRIECIECQNFFKKNMSIGVTNSNIIARRDSINKVGGYQPNSFCFDDRALLYRLGLESPLVAITYPSTLGYRAHKNNASKDIKFITKGALALIANERRNSYPGGRRMKMDRRGLIGSNLLSNMVRRILLDRRESLRIRIVLILKIVISARTMLIIGLMRKMRSLFYYRKRHLIEI
jgi:glycosyltransferase involved in cell wall biosynthesis